MSAETQNRKRPPLATLPGPERLGRHSRTLAQPRGLGLLGEARAVAPDECERDGQRESEEAEEAEFEKKVG